MVLRPRDTHRDQAVGGMMVSRAKVRAPPIYKLSFIGRRRRFIDDGARNASDTPD